MFTDVTDLKDLRLLPDHRFMSRLILGRDLEGEFKYFTSRGIDPREIDYKVRMVGKVEQPKLKYGQLTSLITALNKPPVSEPASIGPPSVSARPNVKRTLQNVSKIDDDILKERLDDFEKALLMMTQNKVRFHLVVPRPHDYRGNKILDDNMAWGFFLSSLSSYFSVTKASLKKFSKLISKCFKLYLMPPKGPTVTKKFSVDLPQGDYTFWYSNKKNIY